MLSLVYGDSHAGCARSRQVGARWRQMAWALGVLGGGLCGCGGDSSDDKVVLADSGS